MNKIMALLLVVSILFLFAGCGVERTGISDYQFMYDGVMDQWNAIASPGAERANLLGFGEYLYNSELILFPRETPSTLQEYYYYWDSGIDVDAYAIYFTCRLDEDAFDDFCDELEDFEVENDGKTVAPLFDETNFALPAYILQWKNVGEKWEVLEYILLDEEDLTVVFVYTMSALSEVEAHSDYTVTPEKMDFLEEDFSIYDEDCEESIYDNSFLDYLK